MKVIGVTGSEGAVGRPLVAALEAAGFEVRRLDIALPVSDPGYGDVRDGRAVRRLVAGCNGIVHLAAVSRVVWGERDPEGCWEVNVEGTRRVLEAALDTRPAPWLVFASSREVYGPQVSLPVPEDAPRNPANTYGRSKSAAETVLEEAQGTAVRVAVLRLSNVYGGLHDHRDRVVPAFCRAAAEGGTMTVRGPNSTCDFTHIDDTVHGMMLVVKRLDQGGTLPQPINLATGIGTTLARLAHLARDAGAGRAAIVEVEPETFAVDHFVGDPTRAREILGWTATVPIEEGVARLVHAHAAARHRG